MKDIRWIAQFYCQLYGVVDMEAVSFLCCEKSTFGHVSPRLALFVCYFSAVELEAENDDCNITMETMTTTEIQ